MAEPKVQIGVNLPLATYERLKRLAKESQTNHTELLIRLIGTDEDDTTQRKALATPMKVRA